MRDVTVAAVNFGAEVGAIEANLERMEAWVRRLASQGVGIVCFPEMSICGYDHSPRVHDWAQSIPGPITDRLEEMAARHEMLVLAGLVEVDGGSLFISQVAIGPEGLIGTYRKTHLGPFERRTFEAGDTVPVFVTDDCTLGIQLCYDTHFPELSAIQALSGAEVLFFPFASPHSDPPSRRERIRRYLPARAYDNTCYVVTCNVAGRSLAGRSFPGTALVLSPKGEVLAEEVGWEEGAAVATLSGGELERIRGTSMGHFRDYRRPELYAPLCHRHGRRPAVPGGPIPYSMKETVE